MLALLGIAVPKIWPLNVDAHIWNWGWIAGSLAVGLAAGIAWVFRRRETQLDAAIELDLRFGLKERVSSALNLSPLERETDVGKALLRDAQHRVKRIDVREHFRPDWNWHPILPIVTAVVIFLVALLAKDATREQASASLNDPAECATTNSPIRTRAEKKAR